MIHVPAPFIYKGRFIPQGDYEPRNAQEEKDLLESISRLKKNVEKSSEFEENDEENGSSIRYSQEELNDLIDEAVAVAKSELNNQIADLQNQIEELKKKTSPKPSN